MRHRLGGVHCQTYEELFDILDSKQDHNCLSLDIQTLLQEQQLNKRTHQEQQAYFFDEGRQIQAEEEDLLLQIESQNSINALRSKNVVLICEQMCQVRKQLLSKEYVSGVYCSIYAQKLAETDEIEVKVVSNIAHVTLKTQDPPAKPQAGHSRVKQTVSQVAQSGPEVKLNVTTQDNVTCFLEYLQLVIYYNKIDHKNNRLSESTQNRQKNTTHQHKIWLLKQQQHYSPLYKVYLQTADRIYRAQLAGQSESQLKLVEVEIEEVQNRAFKDEMGDRGGREFKRWREVLSEIESNGRPQKRRKNR